MSRKQIIAVIIIMSLCFSAGLSFLIFMLLSHYNTYYAADPVVHTETNQPEEGKTGKEEEKKATENKEAAIEENTNKNTKKEEAEKAENIENTEKPAVNNKAADLKAELKEEIKTSIYSKEKDPSEKSLEEIAQLKSNIIVVFCGNSLGSGVIISKDGYIVTNNHVVKSGRDCYIAFEDPGSKNGVGEKIKAELVLADDQKDIALLKISRPVEGVIPIGDSGKLKVGERIVTIGNPNGLINTVADGIVSGFRKTDAATLVQITSPITHGSSGGALLNIKGELVGITTAGFEGGGNLNFAVSSNDIKEFIDGLEAVNGTKNSVN